MKLYHILTGLLLLGAWIFANVAPVGVKTHEIYRPANALAQWCTSWWRQLWAYLRNSSIRVIDSRGIMWLLDGVVLEVHTPR